MKNYNGYSLSSGIGYGKIVIIKSIHDFSAELIGQDTILFIHEINLMIAIECVKKNIAGVVLEKGGYTAHGCILLKSGRIPCVIVNNIMKEVKDSERAIIDGNTGKLMLTNGNQE